MELRTPEARKGCTVMAQVRSAQDLTSAMKLHLNLNITSRQISSLISQFFFLTITFIVRQKQSAEQRLVKHSLTKSQKTTTPKVYLHHIIRRTRTTNWSLLSCSCGNCNVVQCVSRAGRPDTFLWTKLLSRQ